LSGNKPKKRWIFENEMSAFRDKTARSGLFLHMEWCKYGKSIGELVNNCKVESLMVGRGRERLTAE
jgi:hypothetical protein